MLLIVFCFLPENIFLGSSLGNILKGRIGSFSEQILLFKSSPLLNEKSSQRRVISLANWTGKFVNISQKLKNAKNRLKFTYICRI